MTKNVSKSFNQKKWTILYYFMVSRFFPLRIYERVVVPPPCPLHCFFKIYISYTVRPFIFIFSTEYPERSFLGWETHAGSPARFICPVCPVGLWEDKYIYRRIRDSGMWVLCRYVLILMCLDCPRMS